MQAMVFVEWWLVRRIACGLAILALAALAYWLVRRQGRLLRLTMRTLSLGLALVGSLIAALGVLPMGCLSYSKPIYSPGGMEAARLRIADEGALGGGNTVEITSHYGLRHDDVFLGDWASVEPKDIRWLSDSELTISYTRELVSCSSTASVKVHCIAIDKAAH
jgi:hypothetical protein